MAGPLTVAERRRRAAERAGAAAILLAGPLLGLVLYALTGAWSWLVVGAVLLPIARLAARRVARGRPPRTFAEACCHRAAARFGPGLRRHHPAHERHRPDHLSTQG